VDSREDQRRLRYDLLVHTVWSRRGRISPQQREPDSPSASGRIRLISSTVDKLGRDWTITRDVQDGAAYSLLDHFTWNKKVNTPPLDYAASSVHTATTFTARSYFHEYNNSFLRMRYEGEGEVAPDNMWPPHYWEEQHIQIIEGKTDSSFSLWQAVVLLLYISRIWILDINACIFTIVAIGCHSKSIVDFKNWFLTSWNSNFTYQKYNYYY